MNELNIGSERLKKTVVIVNQKIDLEKPPECTYKTEMENKKEKLKAIEDNIKQLTMNKRIWNSRRQK